VQGTNRTQAPTRVIPRLAKLGIALISTLLVTIFVTRQSGHAEKMDSPSAPADVVVSQEELQGRHEVDPHRFEVRQSPPIGIPYPVAGPAPPMPASPAGSAAAELDARRARRDSDPEDVIRFRGRGSGFQPSEASVQTKPKRQPIGFEEVDEIK